MTAVQFLWPECFESLIIDELLFVVIQKNLNLANFYVHDIQIWKLVES